MKLFGRTQPLSKYPIKEALDRLKNLGFDGVEICFENPDIDPDLLDDAKVDELREYLLKLGLTPFSVSFHQDYVYNEDNHKKMVKTIPYAKRLGTDVFVISCPYARKGDEEEWRDTVEKIKELAKFAGEYGVKLAMEPEPRFVIGNTEKLLKLFDEVQSPNLAANLDLGHMFICDPNPIKAIEEVGSRAVHVHIENMKAGIHDHRLPDDGDMDLRQYLDALERIGFDGGMALDMYKYDYEEIAPRALEYIRSLK